MKIQPLSQFNTTSFNAGKTTVFTDFDGSYMPFKHQDVCNSELFSHFKQRDSFNKISKKAIFENKNTLYKHM